MPSKAATADQVQATAPTLSDRGFGVAVAVVLTTVGLYPLLAGADVRAWALLAAGAFLALALARAELLAPLNRLWCGVGRVVQRILNPAILALVFYLVILPTGLVMRSLGRRPLDLRIDPQAGSYWRHREPPGPAPGSMADPF